MAKIWASLSEKSKQAVREILGYLNFSSGSFEPRFFSNVNALFAQLEKRPPGPGASRLRQCLVDGCRALEGRDSAFADLSQAKAVIGLVFDNVLPEYREFHRDLLGHLSDEQLFRPFFVARAFERVLQQGPPWSETARITAGALSGLNNYLGYRPLAVLHDDRKMEPYIHEWVCPIPVYLNEVGVEHGPFAALVERALEILAATPADILFQAFFEREFLDELAVDPRAYDFEHPNHKRANYLYGQWDMGCLDSSGCSRRFVIQMEMLDAMSEWIHSQRKRPREDVIFEAAAVLVGTMLMGSGVSGNRPDSHYSTTALGTILQRIAEYRDAFYERLLERTTGPLGDYLCRDAEEQKQPFGSVRKFLNQRMLQRRARQVQQAALAQFYAELGDEEAAVASAAEVPAVSVRMSAQLETRLWRIQRRIGQGDLESSMAELPELEALLLRAIECGALVDPWNILGFSGQYSLFPGPENSIVDERVDHLIRFVAAIFDCYVLLQTSAAAVGNEVVRRQAAAAMERFSDWWRKYATTEVSGVRRLSGPEICEAARHVAEALGAWHRAGAAAGDVAFWRGHVEHFENPRAYGLVIEELFRRHDAAASMALLVHWLSRHEEVGLNDDDHQFTAFAVEWMERLWRPAPEDESGSKRSAEDRWRMAKKFIDYLEANADDYWQPPAPDWAAVLQGGTGRTLDIDEYLDEAIDEARDTAWDDTLSAAYDDVVFRDSADDGRESPVPDYGPSTVEQELMALLDEVGERLDFLGGIAEMWRGAALASLPWADRLPDRDETLAAWQAQAERNAKLLDELLVRVHRTRVPEPRADQQSLMEYDRWRSLKESLVEDLIAACVEMRDTMRVLAAARTEFDDRLSGASWEPALVGLLHAVFRGDVGSVRARWPEAFERLRSEQLLYLPPSRGGSPQRVAAVRGLHRILRRLVVYLPRLGLLAETIDLLTAINFSEMSKPIGPGAITEFDQLFRAGCRAILDCVIRSSETWTKKRSPETSDPRLLEVVDRMTASLTQLWLFHSGVMRLSAAEALFDEERWYQVVRFIQRYGDDLFTQQFMFFGNLRAILLQGVQQWLEALEEDTPEEQRSLLLRDLGRGLSLREAVDCLSLILETVVEHYSVYIDYNTSTTQSDRGSRLYTLLDFLRLAAEFGRLTWNMEPAMIAHQALIENGRTADAELWREEFLARTNAARRHFARYYAALVRFHGMVLASIRHRLETGLSGPLRIAVVRSLVGPAMRELEQGRDGQACARLRAEIAALSRDQWGVGIELPPWLTALDQEYDRQLDLKRFGFEPNAIDPLLDLPQTRLSFSAIRKVAKKQP